MFADPSPENQAVWLTRPNGRNMAARCKSSFNDGLGEAPRGDGRLLYRATVRQIRASASDMMGL